MMPLPPTQLYKRHRFPAEIIRHGVWLYFRFSLSYRDVQEMMAERGVLVSHEAVRYWGGCSPHSLWHKCCDSREFGALLEEGL